MTESLSIFWVSFFASALETVEAVALLAALGLSQGWRPPILGGLTAVAVLTTITLILKEALLAIPETVFDLLIGLPLMLFAAGWLRKSILRGAGLMVKSSDLPDMSTMAVWIAALAAFKVVMLEGAEVVVIILAVGGRDFLGLATLGALSATALVLIVSLALRQPFSYLPEAAVKFWVGCVLMAFGLYWTAQGLGGVWPSNVATLPALIAIVAATAWGTIILLRSREVAT